MILSSGDKATEEFANGKHVKAFSGFAASAYRLLDALDAATSINDLARVPGNGFEYLKGNREGECSCRINKQWRITFVWHKGDSGPSRVKIEDYH